MTRGDRSLWRKIYFAAQSARFRRCLAPAVDCENPTIRAHSVQNASAMQLLQRNGHVKTPKFEIDANDKFSVFWADVGRNLATTFEGLCSVHDSELFRPIDHEEFDETNSEQLFLYAYRAVIRELHASMEAAIKIQSGYHQRIEAGLDTGNEPEETGLRALNRLLVAHSTFVYKLSLDEAFTTRKFGRLKHKIIRLEDQKPVLAVSACFDLQNRPDNDEPPRVELNVFPVSEKNTVVVFSFAETDASPAEEYLHTVMEASGFYQKYLISRMVLTHAENFVVAPSAFDTWTGEKKERILQFFLRTLHFNCSDESEHLYLF